MHTSPLSAPSSLPLSHAHLTPPEATYCYPLPSALDLALRQLKMHIGIDSIPVVAEIGWLVFNAALYLILFPLAVSQGTHVQHQPQINAYYILRNLTGSYIMQCLHCIHLDIHTPVCIDIGTVLVCSSYPIATQSYSSTPCPVIIGVGISSCTKRLY